MNNPDIENASAFQEDTYKGYELENGDNVDGGYLVEKDHSSYYERGTGFITDAGYCFTLKSPEHASREQVEYIKGYFQTIENMILSGNPDYENYIDLDSFAARFLVDEISLNFDSNVTSMFFYKEQGSDLLYAGPVWDYDGSMGEGNSGWCEGLWVNYEWSTLNGFRESEELNWYRMLYQNERFYNQVISDYTKILPYMENLLNSTIDEYADTIRASVRMDEVRWQNEDITDDKPGHFMEFDNNVRYLKYYLVNRLNYLCERWGVPYKKLVFEGNGEQHEVTFIWDNEIVETRMILDGETIQELLYLDEEKYWGWYYTYSNEKYRNQLPVYESCTLFAMEK